jgi:hypothetical protein
MHYLYYVTMKGVHYIIVAVESNKYYIFLVCVCSLRYPAPEAYVPCCIVCAVLHCMCRTVLYVSYCIVCVVLYCHVACIILPHFSLYLINGAIFGIKVIERISVLIFFTNLPKHVSLLRKKKLTRYEQKCIFVFV